AANTGLPMAKRVFAIRALRGGHFDFTSPVLERILGSHPPPKVEVAAIDSLSAFDEPAAGKVILEHWRGYTPPARKHAVDALLLQTNRIPMLLKAIEEGQVEPSALDGGQRAHFYESPKREIAKKARALLEGTN